MNHIEALCECGLIKKSFGQDQRGIPATFISSIYVVQEIHQGSANRSLPGATDSLPGAGDSPGVVQELHPESVTLLNQSMNQSMNLIKHTGASATPLHRLVLQNRIIPLSSKQPGRHTQNALVAIPSPGPSKPGKLA
jgi:hypothetical protein